MMNNCFVMGRNNMNPKGNSMGQTTNDESYDKCNGSTTKYDESNNDSNEFNESNSKYGESNDDEYYD